MEEKGVVKGLRKKIDAKKARRKDGRRQRKELKMKGGKKKEMDERENRG